MKKEIKDESLKKSENADVFNSGHLPERHNIPEPQYEFNIGDDVVIGYGTQAKVISISEDKKIYELMVNNKHEGSAFPWFSVRPVKNKGTDIYKNNDVRLRFSSSTIEALIHYYYYFGIDMNPEYQRDYVWDDDDRESLLSSIFSNKDIGSFAFAQVTDSEYDTRHCMLEIVDGKQRLNTIIMFYENRLSYAGYFFNDLSDNDKRKFLQHKTSHATIEESTRENILQYFLIMNNSGKTMDKKHLKKVEKMLESITRK